MLTLQDDQHRIWLVTLDGALYRAPVDESFTSVLDVGTGTGIWALEFAEKYPSCHVLGLDLFPVKTSKPVPANCTFQMKNVETEEWNLDRGPFDLIHSRFLVQGMHDWRRYFQKCYEHLRPGGWIEAHEIRYPFESANPSVPADTPFLRWAKLVKDGLAKGGIDAGASQIFSMMLQDVGFEDVVEEKIPWALGSWPQDQKGKRIGEMAVANLEDGLVAITAGSLVKNLGWTQDEVNRFVKEVADDMKDPFKKYFLSV